MKKLRELPESSFLKCLFCWLTACFFIGAVCMPDRGSMLVGLWKIISSPCKVPTSYFYVGGYSATFLNMGLVALCCTLLYSRSELNSTSTLAFILTVGFGAWGIHIVNMWFGVPGVLLYCLVRKEKVSENINPMLFSTGLAPLISDLLLRYPKGEVVGFHVSGVLLALLIGTVIGFFLPAGLANSSKVHKGFSLYSAALPVGMIAFLLQAALFETVGIPLPDAPPAETLELSSGLTVNLFCGLLFGSCILAAWLMGCTPKKYRQLLVDPDTVKDFAARYGNEVFLMNMGIYGLYILLYYNCIGAEFNGVTFGIIFCMLATCNAGSSPANVMPIFMGYAAAAWVFKGISLLMGGDFQYQLSSQAIVVGVCYANGLSPISDKYGWGFGFAAACMHYMLVTSVPELHGGFCLYNGGFTAALICIIILPSLEWFFQTKHQRREKRATKTQN